jgi:hypothetical protein
LIFADTPRLISQRGSVTVVGHELESHGGLPPYSLQIGAHLGDALIV